MTESVQSGTMTPLEAATRLGLSRKSVYDLVEAKILPARRLGVKRGKILLDRADVERYWEGSKEAAKPPEVVMARRHLVRR